MATETTVVHDPRRRAMDAMKQRLAAEAQRLQQQQQKNENEKGNKETSHVLVSSKEPHKADSLPTPSNRSITKDPEDDNFLAYTKLSHPVDENLLATNVKFPSAKGSMANKLLHSLLRSGDSAQKYLQGAKSKNVGENTYVLLDNFVSSASASNKASSQKNSKRSKSRMCIKRLKKSGALNFPQHLQKFDLFKPMHGMWESYMMQLIKVTGKIQLAQNLLSTDLHGAYMFVAECKIASFTGVQGIMVRETSQTFGIITRDNKFRVVPKKASVFIIQLNCWKITLHGDKFTSRDNILLR